MNKNSKLALNTRLLIELTKRELLSKYKGTYFGILWYILAPLSLLTVYSVFFTQIIRARWASTDLGPSDYVLNIFSGLIIYNFFAEVFVRSAKLIINNTNYVKKVVFPLPALPLSILIGALVNQVLSSLIFVIFIFIIKGGISFQAFLMIPIFISQAIMCLGFSFLISSVGVYVRDLPQVIGLGVSILLFLSPVFYSIESLSPRISSFIMVNPISYPINAVRTIALHDGIFDLKGYLAYTAIAILVCFYFYKIFRKLRTGFADVL
jgi:lipopolysaccharide transport system permease protein